MYRKVETLQYNGKIFLELLITFIELTDNCLGTCIDESLFKAN